MTLLVTIELATDDRSAAQALLEDKGFTVTRVAKKPAEKATAGVTPRNMFRRASATLDQPEGLDDLEARAYHRGYAQGCTKYSKRQHYPTLSPADPDWRKLRRMAVEYEWDRHPACHTAGLKELERWREHWAQYQADLARRRAQKTQEVAA